MKQTNKRTNEQTNGTSFQAEPSTMLSCVGRLGTLAAAHLSKSSAVGQVLTRTSATLPTLGLRIALPSLLGLRTLRTTTPSSSSSSSASAAAAALHTRDEGKVLVPGKSGSSAGLSAVRSWVHDFSTGERVGLMTLDPVVFGAQIRPDVMQRVVVFHLARLRAGTAHTKSRGEVSGSTRKMYQQKGSGRARRGSKRAPGLKGGGRAHGPKPRDMSIALPKKVLAMGLRSALSAKLAQNEMVIAQGLHPGTAASGQEAMTTATATATTTTTAALKTKWFDQRVRALQQQEQQHVEQQTALFLVTPRERPLLARLARNIPHVTLALVTHAQVYDILRHSLLVLSPDAVRLLTDRYATAPTAPPPTPLWLQSHP